jgi:hypothetical protein
MTMNKIVLALGTLLAACSGSAVPAAVAPAPQAALCDGGSVRSDAELERFTHCTAIAGDLVVSGVTSMKPLEDVRTVYGTLSIRRTERLYTLTGLENLRRVNALDIEENRGLISIGSLKSLTRAKSVSIVANPRLSRSGGSLDGLTRVAGDVTVKDNLGLRAEGVAVGEHGTVL